MIYTIKKGRHNASPFHFKLFWSVPKTLTFIVKFDENCQYDLYDVDQLDCNKLVGLGFLNFKKFPPHHYESVRVGWRWNWTKRKMELLAYWCTKGQRKIQYLCDTALGISAVIYFHISDSKYRIDIVTYENGDRQTSPIEIDRGITPKIAYFLGPYFGGNERAPKEMNITIH